MNSIALQLQDLYNRTPRRHNDDNVKEINSIITDYEEILIEIEAINENFEKVIVPYFDTMDTIQSLLKQSNDRKASKKNKDNYFDEASGLLKENIENLIEVYNNGI